MAHYALLNRDGDLVDQVETVGEATPTQVGRSQPGTQEVRVDRPGRAGERVADGRWEKDPIGWSASIDTAHRTKHGKRSIEIAHVQKAIEARLILGGLVLPDSLIGAEARALNIPLLDLAATILARAAVAEDAEVARRVAKAAS